MNVVEQEFSEARLYGVSEDDSSQGAKTAVRRSGNAMSSRMALTLAQDHCEYGSAPASTSTRGRPRRFRDDTPTSRVERFSYLTLQPFGRGSSIEALRRSYPTGEERDE